MALNNATLGHGLAGRPGLAGGDEDENIHLRARIELFAKGKVLSSRQ